MARLSNDLRSLGLRVDRRVGMIEVGETNSVPNMDRKVLEEFDTRGQEWMRDARQSAVGQFAAIEESSIEKCDVNGGQALG